MNGQDTAQAAGQASAAVQHMRMQLAQHQQELAAAQESMQAAAAAATRAEERCEELLRDLHMEQEARKVRSLLCPYYDISASYHLSVFCEILGSRKDQGERIYCMDVDCLGMAGMRKAGMTVLCVYIQAAEAALEATQDDMPNQGSPPTSTTSRAIQVMPLFFSYIGKVLRASQCAINTTFRLFTMESGSNHE